MKQQFSGALVSCMRREASGHSFAYVRVWELLGNGADTHLVDMFLRKKALWQNHSRLSPQRQAALEGPELGPARGALARTGLGLV